MDMDDDACYRAIETRDHRFDGRMFVAVTSTGIYCRPFSRRAAEARELPVLSDRRGGARGRVSPVPALSAGDLARPGVVARQFQHRLARARADRGRGARRRERRGFGDAPRHGRAPAAAPVPAALGASPISVAQTRRFLLAKQLIQETRLPMAEIASAAGFGSVRRFNEIFQQLFGGRRRRSVEPASRRNRRCDRAVTVRLGYRPPYDWDSILSFLRARAIPGIEAVSRSRMPGRS